jgi:predicted MFS family arabinose efflux permease
MNNNKPAWDSRYEWKAVLLLAFGFGLVGLDRFIILPLFPAIMKDLALDYQDLGNISAVLALAWALSSILIGRISDTFGRRKVLIPSLIIFSLLAGVSGLASGIASLLMIRAVMGVAEGAFTTTSIATNAEVSHPLRRGRNMGIQLGFFPLLGLGLAPIIATQLLAVVPSWRWVFAIVALPGFVLAWLIYRNLKETRPQTAKATTTADSVEKHSWLTVLRHRNMPLNIICMCCALTCLFVVSVMTANYLTDYLHLSIPQMGFVMSAIGFGGFTGDMIMPSLSDRFGRKPVLLISFVATALFLWLLTNTGAEPLKLFGLLFMTTFFNFSMICVINGPLTSESVTPSQIATATGLVVGAAELFGGAVAPALAGFIAQHYGIEKTLLLALGSLGIGLVVSLFLKETLLSKRKSLSDQGFPASGLGMSNIKPD